jgi:hypothetical protein
VANPLSSTAASPIPTISTSIPSPIIASPAYAGLRIQRECLETPTPASTRPSGSPIKWVTAFRLSPVPQDPIDPTPLQVTQTQSESASDVDASNGGFSIGDDDSESEEDDVKKELKKRFTSAEIIYETNKRKRSNIYRNSGDRLRENLRKIGNATKCYGILFLAGDGSVDT